MSRNLALNYNIDMYTEIQVDISYFNLDTKKNSDPCLNAEKPQILWATRYVSVTFVYCDKTAEVMIMRIFVKSTPILVR